MGSTLRHMTSLVLQFSGFEHKLKASNLNIVSNLVGISWGPPKDRSEWRNWERVGEIYLAQLAKKPCLKRCVFLE